MIVREQYSDNTGLRQSKVGALNEGIIGITETLNRLDAFITEIAGNIEQPKAPSNQKEPEKPQHIAYIISKLPEFHKHVIYRIEEIEKRLKDAFV